MSDENGIEDDLRLREIAADYLLQAMDTIPPSKVDDMLSDWAKGHLLEEPDDDQAGMMTEIALDACLFNPSMSGSTPLSRFLAGVKTDDPLSRQAVQALSRSEIRLIRIDSRIEPELVVLKDLSTGERITLVDEDFIDESAGLDALMRLCRLDSGRYILISFPFAIEEAAFGIVDSFRRPGKGIANPYRCACAVSKHAIRQGIVAIPRREPTDEEIAEAAAAQIAEAAAAIQQAWEEAKSDPEKHAEFTETLRELAGAESLLSYLQIYTLALSNEVAASPENMRDMCSLIIEELVQRQRSGDDEAQAELREARQAIGEAVEEGYLDKKCQTLFDSLVSGDI